ncbi:hypothetical protein HPB48_007286 [Haemaphysalis longicornis]|uniref:Peptidase M13 N-terminal domain-containing protein n=1 Tax=Haemaphysalis longicornis TaxID=44386 RepID=A0A9J6FPI7_HAELO|nr:hypothetical protein HPB48_007286 [Haemaphysalis longicornis]
MTRQRLLNSGPQGQQDIDGTRRPQAGFIIVVAAFLTAALFAATLAYALFTAAHRSPLRGTPSPFCCPEEAETMARYVNFSANPCTDLFTYVCQNHPGGLSLTDTGQQAAERVIMTASQSEGATKGKAGQFLTAYFKSCVEAVSRRELFLSDLAYGLVRAMQEVVLKPDTRNAMAYFIVMSFKYQLPSWIRAFVFSPGEIQLEVNLTTTRQTLSLEQLEALEVALKETTNVTVQGAEALRIKSSLYDSFPNLHWIARMRNYLLDDTFDRDVWSVEEFKDGLSIFGYSVNAVRVRGARAVKAIYDVFAAPATEIGDGVKAVFLLWKSADSAISQFHLSNVHSPEIRFLTCRQSTTEMSGLWGIFLEELYAHPEKQRMATAVFAAVKDAVYGDCRASNIFEAEDAAHLEIFFRHVSILNSIGGGEFAAPVPIPDQNFTVNLLKGRGYAKEFNRKASGHRSKTSNEDLFEYYRNNSLLYFLPHVYKNAIPGSSFRSNLLNMAVLGRVMTESLWHVVLHDINWGSRTKDNIRRLAICFHRSYRVKKADSQISDRASNVPASLVEALRTAADALGLASTLKAFERLNWHNVKPAWSLRYWSHAQLFYIFSTVHRCPDKWSSEKVKHLNSVVMEVEDFSKAFRCSNRASSENRSRCIPTGITTE